MPIQVSLDLDTLGAEILEGAERLAGGSAAEALGGEAPADGGAWYVYRTQGDERVRPTHRALDGTVWRFDDPRAPVPPIAFGCRCFIEPCAPPDGDGGGLPEAPADPQTTAEAFAADLDEHVAGWRDVAKEAATKPATIRFAWLRAAMRGRFTASEADDLARMILDVLA